jgi:hypothetical protein
MKAAAPFACVLAFVSPTQLWLPDVVSTDKSEVRITFSPDGKHMLWGAIGWSNGVGGWDIYESERTADGGQGKHDLFIAHRTGTTWGRIENLEALNTPDEDFDATFLHDGVSVVYTSGKFEDDSVALYVAEFRDGRYQPRERLPNVVNSQKQGAWTFGPSVSAHDPGALSFTSQHEQGRGRADIYRIEYRIR